MNATTYNPETQVASIQPGSIWQGVYETLDPWNVTVPGGRAASVGVAGFLSGGGNSFYGARKGFACDNVVNFEVVLASGEVINANASDNADLFQALKGGQSNFGVITRFDMQAFDAPPLWGGVVQYNKTTGPQQIDAYVNWTANLNNFTQGSAIMFWTYQPALKDIIIIDAFDDTTGAVAASGFDQFLAIPNNLSSSLRVASHLELTVELAQPAGYRDIWFTATIRNNKLVYEKIIQLHEQLCDISQYLSIFFSCRHLKKSRKGKFERLTLCRYVVAAQSPDGDFITQAMFQSIPTVFSQHSVEKGGNVLGLDRETENVVMLLFTLAVKGLDQEAVAQKQMRLFADATVAYADSLNSLVEWQYINYANDWQDPLGSYGAENIAKIKAAASKFDPAGIFQTRAPGGFKISKTSDSWTT